MAKEAQEQDTQHLGWAPGGPAESKSARKHREQQQREARDESSRMRNADGSTTRVEKAAIRHTDGSVTEVQVTLNGEPTQRRNTTRLSADLPIADAETLTDLQQATGTNKVTTLVRAIRVFSELLRAEREGGELTIRYNDGRRERLRFL